MNLALAVLASLLIGAAGGYWLKADRTIVQVQKVLVKEHDQAVKLEAQHDQRKAEVERGIRSARATAGDCDRAPANAGNLKILDGYPRRSGAR